MRTDYLFAMPSFLTGVARLLDLSGRFDVYNDSSDEAIADARAIYTARGGTPRRTESGEAPG